MGWDPTGHELSFVGTAMSTAIIGALASLVMSPTVANAPRTFAEGNDPQFNNDHGMNLALNIGISQAIGLGIKYIAAPVLGKLLSYLKSNVSVSSPPASSVVETEVMVEVPTYRGEAGAGNADADIGDAFNNGLPNRGGSTAPQSLDNLVTSINVGSAKSGFTQSSESADVAIGFATNGGKRGGVLYELVSRADSVRVADSPIANQNNFPFQKIVAHPGGIKASQILRAYVLDKSGKIIRVVENPHYGIETPAN